VRFDLALLLESSPRPFSSAVSSVPILHTKPRIALPCSATSSDPDHPTPTPDNRLMEAKMGRFFESVSNFFTGGDHIPWCDRDLIAVSALGTFPSAFSLRYRPNLCRS
jgi:hypothetical protein